MNSRVLANELSSRYGKIKRARGPFLYTEKGVRLTDLFQENGKAVLGWGGGSAFTMLKNTLARGLTGSFNTDYTYRVQKAVSVLLNSDRVILEAACMKAAEHFASSVSEKYVYYKPWDIEGKDYSKEECVIIEPPLPWCSELYIVAAAATEENIKKAKEAELYVDAVPAPVEAGIARSIYDLIAAVQEREEKDWFIYDKVLTRYWERKGPYLVPKIPEDKYDSFVLHCLDNGIVINPLYNSLCIVPFGADKGVFAQLEKNPFEV